MEERDAESARIQHKNDPDSVVIATHSILHIEVSEDKCVGINEITDL